MAISDEITRLQQAKADLKTAIENKGVTVSSSATLDDYASLVDNIEAGSSGGSSSTTDDWLYLYFPDVLITGTTSISLNYSNSSNLTVERLVSNGDFASNAYNWSTSKIIIDGPGRGTRETWFRIKPNNMNVGDTGGLSIYCQGKTMLFEFQLIETFSDNQSYQDGADIERLSIINITGIASGGAAD